MLRVMRDSIDPRNEVEAPVRHALAALVFRGVVLVGLVAALVLLPSHPALGALREPATALVPMVLFSVALLLRIERRVRGRPDEASRAAAWARARAVDEADATLALVVAGWVPVALAAALVVLVGPHFSEPDLEVRGAWWGFGIPLLLTAWIVATNAWLDATRDELARASGEADRRFRAYWANPDR
jgi:hypothetical protein